MSASLRGTLGTLATLPGVRAAVAATRSDGMAAATVAAADVDADALAAGTESVRLFCALPYADLVDLAEVLTDHAAALSLARRRPEAQPQWLRFCVVCVPNVSHWPL